MNPAAAARLFGLPAQEPRLISHRENAVYEVALARGRAALRLHRPGYRTEAEIRSELIWTEALADAGFPAPRPLRTQDGALMAQLPDGQTATMIAWMEGTPIGAGGTALEGDRRDLYRRVGMLLARLHAVSDGLDLPQGFIRPLWDADGLTGPDPLWGRAWAHPALSGAEAALILAARDRARALLTTHDGALDRGLIHADALRENVFQTGAGLALIDFDDSGIGYRMYDLVSALTQSLDDADHDDLASALMEGYGGVRHLPQTVRDLFPLFAMLRAFSAVGWMIPRVAPDDPKTALYLARALRLARAYG